MKRTLLLLFIASSVCCPKDVFASRRDLFSVSEQGIQQTGPLVKGVVTDAQGDPLPGVSVYVTSIKKGCLTDINGAYTLQLPQSGTY